MNKIQNYFFFIISLGLVLYIAYSCNHTPIEKSVSIIHNLERERNTEPDIFDPFLGDSRLYVHISRAIGRIGDSTHIPVLAKIIQSDIPEAKKPTIFALGQIDHDHSRRILERLVQDSAYLNHRINLISALGINGDAQSLKLLKEVFKNTPDSLKPKYVQAMANLARKLKNSQQIQEKIIPLLQAENQLLRQSAAYYLYRNPARNAAHSLIRAVFSQESIGNKYRYKALESIFRKYNRLPVDSTLQDSLHLNLLHTARANQINWRIKLPIIGLLAYYEDSLTVNEVAEFLNDTIPHVRLKAIQTLGIMNNPYVRHILLDYYQSGSWAEKGHIICALASMDGQFTYRLIQQNLDRGTIHFKALLLRALANINRRQSIALLRQFFLVPNKRLQYVAFTELAKIGRIRQSDVMQMIQSGDPALITAAAEWLLKHPKSISLADLKQCYKKLKEPDDLEAMIALMRTMGFLNYKEEQLFFINSLKNAQSSILFQQIKKYVSSETDTIKPKFDLFVPDSLFEDEICLVRLETERGAILIELWPEVARFTVSNFIKLIRDDFYKALSFHRVVSDFVVQGGDPRGDGWGGPGYYIPCEYSDLPYVRGSIGIATAGKDTGGCQFFICHSEQPHLNGKYTLFGRVLEGMQIVDSIQIDDKIIDVVLLNRGET